MPDQEEIHQQLSLLREYRRTLAHYLQQQARLGLTAVPPHVVSGIFEARENIQRVKSILRQWQVSFEDHPDDSGDFSIVEHGFRSAELPSNPIKTSLQLRVLLCYSFPDRAAVSLLYKRLLDDGVAAWFDEENILPGQEQRQELLAATRAADVIVVCLSQSSTSKSGYLSKEIRDVLDIAAEKPPGTMLIIPARLEECKIPKRIDYWREVDLFLETGYDKLMRSLLTRAAKLKNDKMLAPVSSHVSQESNYSLLEQRQVYPAAPVTGFIVRYEDVALRHIPFPETFQEFQATFNSLREEGAMIFAVGKHLLHSIRFEQES